MKRSLSNASSIISYVTAEDDITPQADWAPSTLARGVSPPPIRRGAGSKANHHPKHGDFETSQPTTAQVEAGTKDVANHVDFFSTRLAASSLAPSSSPRLPHSEWLDLYHRNESSSGHHFVIHQHDHPVAGTHYDLRLQINATSSISFAVMYGLPGDPNSKRLNRNATETRVHCVWNHLIETASPQTGTMLIWDTGEYEILEKPAPEKHSLSDTESDSEDVTSFQSSFSNLPEAEKLASAFSYRKVRLRLHGTRLPTGYTIYLRLTKNNDRSAQPKAPAFKRQRKSQVTEPALRHRKGSTTSVSSEASSSRNSRSPSLDGQHGDSMDNTQATHDSTHRRLGYNVSSLKRIASPPRRLDPGRNLTQHDVQQSLKPTSSTQPSTLNEQTQTPAPLNAHAPGDEFVSTSTAQAEQDQIRLTNAYPGAHNTVNSIHQRKWYLSLDRTLSGFIPIPTPRGLTHHAKTYWIPILQPDCGIETDEQTQRLLPLETRGRGQEQKQERHHEQQQRIQQQARLKRSRNAPGFRSFHVLGRDHEHSVVTGRLAAQILVDEGVEGFVPRGRWRAVVE